jgi:hypothetical protein
LHGVDGLLNKLFPSGVSSLNNHYIATIGSNYSKSGCGYMTGENLRNSLGLENVFRKPLPDLNINNLKTLGHFYYKDNMGGLGGTHPHTTTADFELFVFPSNYTWGGIYHCQHILISLGGGASSNRGIYTRTDSSTSSTGWNSWVKIA